MTANTGVHTCNYYCERPECIKRQRDELRDRMESVLASAPPSAPVGADFAAVASILRRAMRDGAHYGYRREFILQQALALEALSQQPEAVDEAKETGLWRCTVCGRVGTVGRCCGEETRERANMESLQEVDMAITGGFGTTLDMERGTSRKWVMGSDGVKRWADSGLHCEPPSCDECEYCFPDEVRDGDDYVWKHYCNLAEPGGKAIEIDEGECCPDWCPLAMIDEHNGGRND